MPDLGLEGVVLFVLGVAILVVLALGQRVLGRRRAGHPEGVAGEHSRRYVTYLQSAQWRRRRQRALRRAHYQCQQCGARPPSLDVHHLTYQRLGQERDRDLRVLCEACHQRVHARLP